MQGLSQVDLAYFGLLPIDHLVPIDLRHIEPGPELKNAVKIAKPLCSLAHEPEMVLTVVSQRPPPPNNFYDRALPSTMEEL